MNGDNASEQQSECQARETASVIVNGWISKGDWKEIGPD